MGTHNLASVPELVRRAGRGGAAAWTSIARRTRFDVPDSAVAHSSRVRAYVTAIEGCNHVCSFCVVPRTRGAEVCRDPAAIVDEVRSLVARGYPRSCCWARP